MTNSADDRDFFAEGYDAAACGKSDLAPNDVTIQGSEAEASWNDGYNQFMDDLSDRIYGSS